MMMKKTTQLMLSTIAAAIAMTSFSNQAIAEDGINVGGAVRVNYSYKDYSDSSKDLRYGGHQV
jgi:hypothetical protein